MAVTPAFEEALRLTLETRGAEGINDLQVALAQLSGVSSEVTSETSRLIDRLDAIGQASEKAARLDELNSELAEAATNLANAENAAYQLTLAVEGVENPSREMVRALKAARKELDKQRDAFEEQSKGAAELEEYLAAVGTDTSDLVAAQAELESGFNSTTAQIHEQVAAIKAQMAAEARRRAQLEDEDRQFREQAEASRAAGESLENYRDRAADAADQTEDLSDAVDVSNSLLSKLKGVAAAALGFFSFSTLMSSIKSVVQEGADAEQELGQLEAALASTGRQAEFTAEKLQQIGASLETGLFSGGEITNAQTRLLSYTNIVGEQYPKALQLAIDQAQRLGMTTEASAELVGRALQTPAKAMEALGKQGFVLEDSQKQLLKQLEATGRTAEAQAIILDLLVESYGGSAAAAKVGTMAGLWHQVQENFRDFQQSVSEKGVLEYFKSQLSELLATADRLAQDGTLGRWARQAGDAIVALASTVKGATVWVVEHRNAIVTMAKAYAAFKIGQALLAMNAWRIAVMAATRAQLAQSVALGVTEQGAWKLGRALRAIPTGLKIGVALVGMDLAMRYAADFGEWMGKNSEAAKQLGEVQEKVRQDMIRAAAGYARGAKGLEQYHHQQVLNTEAAAQLGDAERERYAAGLQGLKSYLIQLHMYYMSMQEAGALVGDMGEKWKQVQERLRGVNQGLADLAKASDVAGAALERGIGVGAQLIIEKLEGIDGDAKLAADSIKKLFEGLNFDDSNTLGDVGVALGYIAQEGARADRNVRSGLMAVLQKLSGEELLRFQVAAQAAFEAIPDSATASAAVLDQTLVAAMEKLGISAERMGVKFTAAGRDATAAFSAILENANATSAQIEVAFKAALSKVATLDEAKALGAVLEAAGQQGKVGFDQTERAAAALQARIEQITNAMDPLSDEFSRLGITSQASLNAAKDAAKDAFDAIRRGAAVGTASIEDVRRAMKAYGAAARASVADSDSSARSRVESELTVLEAIYRTNEATEELGRTAGKSSRIIADGAASAAEGYRDMATAADGAGEAAAGVAQAAGESSGRFEQLLQGTTALSSSLEKVGEGFMEAMSRMFNSARAGSPVLQQFAAITNELARQRAELTGLASDLDMAASKYDTAARRREQLRNQFGFVSDAELDAVIEKENHVMQLRQQQADERSREADAERKSNEARLAVMKEAEKTQRAAGPAMDSGEDRLVIDWRAPSKGVAASASAAEMEQAERLAALVAPLVMQRIERSRSVSLRKRAGR